MISFICENANVETLENVVKKALINCVAEAVSPLFGDYDRTRLDYSSCKTEWDKRILFAKDFLGDINIEPIEGGIVLNDELYVSTLSFNAFADGVAVDSAYVGNDNYKDLSATVGKGKKAIGYIFYEVPTDAKKIVIDYNAEFWTDGNSIEFIVQE